MVQDAAGPDSVHQSPVFNGWISVYARHQLGVSLTLEQAAILGRQWLNRHNLPTRPDAPWAVRIPAGGTDSVVMSEKFVGGDTRWITLGVESRDAEPFNLRAAIYRQSGRPIEQHVTLTVEEASRKSRKWIEASEATNTSGHGE